ncbi:MAG TPA: alanine racemase [Stellaceae bacterium]|nr:alanine racemase [Stellaceae bacterium]
MASADTRAPRPGGPARPRARATARASPEARAGAVLTIDLDAIAGNWLKLAERVGPSARCAAVVKADCYGLGMAKVAPALARAGCKTFFVASLDEGLELRALLPRAQIAVLNGLVIGTPADFAKGALMPVLNDLGQLGAWRSYAMRRGGAPAMLHLDTGMARLGLPPQEIARLAAEPALLRGFTLALVLSHLACASEPAHPMNVAQLEAFRAALRRLPQMPASLAASSGIFLGGDFHFDMVRAGAALYGVNPSPGRPNPMRPTVHLKAKILQIRDVDRGESVGYGAAHRIDRPARIATIAMGYADGWLRSSAHRGVARIAGKPAPVVGQISMDLLTLDVTGHDPATVRPGEYVDLLDERYGVDDAALAARTIGYEILTALGRRCHRVYRGGAR